MPGPPTLARRLAVSEHTVAEHLQNLYRKAGVSGRAELAAVLFDRQCLPPRSAGVPPSPYGYFVGIGDRGNRSERVSDHGRVFDESRT